mgnify:CR=1 FL=1
MHGLDLNEQYIKAAKLINEQIHPLPNCQFVVGNSLHLPFAKHSFEFVISQHACMNIDQKQSLLKGLHKVIKPQGQLLMHEIILGPQAHETDMLYPTPWAQEKSESYLCHWHAFEHLALTAGFKLEYFSEHSAAALSWIKHSRQQPAPTAFKPSLVLGAGAAAMSNNTAHNLAAGSLQVVNLCLRKP